MSKYEPLWKYLSGQDDTVIELSFDSIKDILGFTIDHSFLNYKKELHNYDYNVRKIYLKEKKVVFEKLKVPRGKPNF
jgi:hypothetical protein